MQIHGCIHLISTFYFDPFFSFANLKQLIPFSISLSISTFDFIFYFHFPSSDSHFHFPFPRIDEAVE